MDNVDKFLIVTNPLSWVYFLYLLVVDFITLVWVKSGINDWWFILVKARKLSKKEKNAIANNLEQLEPKKVWLKRKAFEYCIREFKTYEEI